MSDISSVEWLPTFGHRFLRHNPLGPLPAYAYSAYAGDHYYNRDRAKDLKEEKGKEDKPKPPYSYASLIRLAITNCSKGKMTLSEIYQYIIATFPYYRDAGTGWKNSIRHNLSLNKCFRKLARGKDDPGKGSYWAIDSNYSQDDAIGKRRKGLHCLQRVAPYSPECSSNSSGDASSSTGAKDKDSIQSEQGVEAEMKLEVLDAASDEGLSVLEWLSPPECVSVPPVCSSGRHRGTHTDRYGNFNEQAEEECNCSPLDDLDSTQMTAVNIPGYSQYSVNLSANYENGYGSFSSSSELCSPVQMDVGFFDTQRNLDNGSSPYVNYKYRNFAAQDCDFDYSENGSRNVSENGAGFQMQKNLNNYENSPLHGFDCL